MTVLLRSACTLIAATLGLFLGNTPAFCSDSPVGSPSPTEVKLSAPVWHVGDWWRIRVPLLSASAVFGRLDKTERPPVDSTTEFDVYRYQVMGQENLPKSLDDPSTPAVEKCWVIKVVDEKGTDDGVENYLLYFRVSDQSLRSLKIDHRRGKHHNIELIGVSGADGPRIPFVDNNLPPIADWPVFPLVSQENPPKIAPSTLPTTSNVKAMQQVTQSNVKVGVSTVSGFVVRVQYEGALSNQHWVANYPWWVHSDRNGLRNAELIEAHLTK